MFSTCERISRAKSESCIESANYHRHNTKKKEVYDKSSIENSIITGNNIIISWLLRILQ